MKWKTPVSILVLIFATIVSLPNCGGEKCTVSLSKFYPSSENVEIIAGKFQNFYFSVNTCGGKIKTISWEFDNSSYDANTTLTTVEACPDLKGTHTLKVTVKTSSKTLTKTWNISIVKKADPDVPECYTKAIETVQEGIVGVTSKESPTGMNMSDAYACIKKYLKLSPCNLEANMAAGIAHLALTFANLPVHLALAFSAFNNGVESLIKSEIDPPISFFSTVADHGDSRFKFVVDKMVINIPVSTNPKKNITLNLSGRYDIGDAKFFTAVLKIIKGLLETGLAYNGFYELPLLFVENDWQVGLIERLQKDSTFLLLTGKDGRDGKKHLQTAQKDLVDGITRLMDAIIEIESDSNVQISYTNPENNDVIKYWDCGEDGVCPPKYSQYPDGDPREPFEDDNHNGKYDPGEKYEDLNQNGHWNDSWQNIGSDEGEDDGQYTDGEPIGTELIVGHPIKFTGGSKLMSFLTAIRDNIKGPEPLDLDEFFGVKKGTIQQQFEQLGIPYPEIRLSEFFVTPSNLRNLFPLYSISEKKFFNQPEEEPWKDYGVDQLPDEKEPGYNKNSNPDPDHDNYDLETNMNDGYDNDGDGLIDNKDPDGDWGLEGNGKYDYLDTAPTNGKQDIGEKCEPFEDIGIDTPNGIYGSNNGAWDQLDTDHKWPKGSDVGGPQVNIDIDPKNGTIKDPGQKLIDEFYLFFPDATFSNVLIFPNPTKNIDGKTLTRNAELFRFIEKIKENADYLLSF